MSNCIPFTGGIPKDCDNNSGGIKRYIYLTDFDNITTYTEAGGTVSAITLAGATATYGFQKFEMNKNSGEFKQSSPKNLEAGSLYVEQVIDITIPRMTVAKRNVLDLLKNRYLVAIVPDNNNIYWVVGIGEGAYMTELTSTSGKARGDGSSYHLVLTAEENEDAFAIASATLPALLV